MKDGRNGGSLPAIGIAALAIGCCLLAPVLIGGAGAAIAAWLSGLTIGESVALAGLAAGVIYGVIRMRKVMVAAADTPAPTSDETDGRPR